MALKKYALSDVCTIVPGFAFKSNEFGSGENIAVKIKDIEPPSVNIKNAERVCFTPQDKFRLSKGDYIMAMTGATIGKVGKLQIDAKNVYINQRVCKFNPITSVCDKEYLYYVLSAPSFRNFIYNNVDSKLAQPNIGHPTIYKYTHLFPTDIKEQKLIASVLNNIDCKIELNKQINDNFTDIPQRYVCDRTKETKLLAAGDLVIEKSGGSPTQSTGRIVYVSEDLIKVKGNVVCSNFCTAFRVKAGWNPLYVYYYWQNVYNQGAFFNFEGKTSGIKNLQLDNALSAIDIEHLPLEKQNQIVASLASIDEKIKVNRQINDNLPKLDRSLKGATTRLVA